MLGFPRIRINCCGDYEVEGRCARIGCGWTVQSLRYSESEMVDVLLAVGLLWGNRESDGNTLSLRSPHKAQQRVHVPVACADVWCVLRVSFTISV